MSSGPTETEIKIALTDARSATALLTAKDFQIIKPRVFEANIVLDTPHNLLRSSGRLLRIRCEQDCILTYKGPAVRSRHKSREEIEVRVSDPAAAQLILKNLGYFPTFRYEKYRTEFARQSDQGLITLDETPIGCFLELEGESEWIDHAAMDLGFDESQYITESYGSLYRRHCETLGVEPSDMVF
jgi:adenylate cyclase, class 2